MSDTEIKISVKLDNQGLANIQDRLNLLVENAQKPIEIKLNYTQALNNIQKSLSELVENAQKPIDIRLNGKKFVDDAVETAEKAKQGIQGTLSNIGLKIFGARQVKAFADHAADFIYSFVDIANKSVTANNLVKGAILATGGAAGYTADQFQKMALQLQHVSNYDDTEILANVIPQFTLLSSRKTSL